MESNVPVTFYKIEGCFCEKMKEPNKLLRIKFMYQKYLFNGRVMLFRDVNKNNN